MSWYVATTGSDSNNGSQASPFRTLAAAQNAARNSSDKTITVRGGTYTLASNWSFDQSDSNQTWVPFTNETPIIEGGGVYGVLILNVNNFTMNGFTFNNLGAADSGTGFTGGIIVHWGSNITLRWNTLNNAHVFGINGGYVQGLVCSDNTVNGVTVHGGNTAGVQEWSAAIQTVVSNAVDMSHNLVQNCHGVGISMGGANGSVPSSDVLIDRNLLINCCNNANDLGPIYTFDPAQSVTNVRWTNNIVRGCGNGTMTDAIKGLYLDASAANFYIAGNIVSGHMQWGQMVHGGSGNTVTNNIFDLSGGSLASFYQINDPAQFPDLGMGGNSFTKNIFYTSGSWPTAPGGSFSGSLWEIDIFGDDANPSVHDNLYYSATGASVPNDSGLDTHKVVANPQFTNPGAGDYSMPSNSPFFTTLGGAAFATDQGPRPNPYNSGGSGTQPIIDSFGCQPASLPSNGGSAVLAWTVRNATSVSIDNGVGDVTGQNSRTVNVYQTTTFQLTARDSSNNATYAQVQVIVAAPGSDPGNTTGFYVSPTGSDSNDGSFAHPFQTLAHAQTALRSASNKTVNLRAGTYTLGGHWNFDSSDNGQTWIPFPGETPIIDGASSYGVLLDSVSNWTMNGFTFNRMGTTAFPDGDAGAIAMQYGGNITMRWNTFNDAQHCAITGVTVTSVNISDNTFNGVSNHVDETHFGPAAVNFRTANHNATFDHNLFQNIEGAAIGVGGGPYGQPQYATNNVSVDRNLLIDTCTTSKDMGSIYFFDPSRVSTGFRITNNYILRSGNDPSNDNIHVFYMDDGVSNSYWAGNIVDAKSEFGLVIHGGNGNLIENNIFDLSNGNSLGLYQTSTISPGGSMSGNEFRKNIVYSATGFALAWSGKMWNNFTSNGEAAPNVHDNLYFSANGSSIPTADYPDTNPIYANPQFANAAGNDYSMPSSSPFFTSLGGIAFATDQGPRPNPYALGTGGTGTTGGGSTPPPPPLPTIDSFVAQPNTLPEGGGTTVLSWTTRNASHIVIDNSVGDVSGQTSVSVNLTATTTFHMTADDGNGNTAQKQVTIIVRQPNAGGTPVTTGIYVSPSGNDANDGSSGSPLKTLAAAQAMLRGLQNKTVNVHGGTYTLGAHLIFTASDSGQTWLAYPGETPIIDGASNYAVQLGSVANWTMNGFTFNNMGIIDVAYSTGDPGDLCAVTMELCSNITMRWNTFNNVLGGAILGMRVASPNISDNTVNGSRHYAPAVFPTAAINFRFGITDAVFAHNVTRNTEGPGIAVAGGNLSDPTSSNVLIDRNLIIDSCLAPVFDHGAIYTYDGAMRATGFRITNNFILRTGSNAGSDNVVAFYLDQGMSNSYWAGNIVVMHGPSGSGGTWSWEIHGGKNNLFEYNIFDLTNGNAWGLYNTPPSDLPDQSMTGNEFRKNIVYSAGGFSLYWSGQMIEDRNL